MDADTAARVLGVRMPATAADVERAFARRARETHPDVAGTDGTAFVEASAAREVLLGVATVSGPRGPDDVFLPGERLAPGERRRWVPGPRPVPHVPSAAFIPLWVAFLVVAAFISIYDARLPLTIAEPIVRWTLLAAALVAFSLTGLRSMLVLALALIALTAAVNVVVTSIASLGGVLLIAPAALGLLSRGVLVDRRRSALAGEP